MHKKYINCSRVIVLLIVALAMLYLCYHVYIKTLYNPDFNFAEFVSNQDDDFFFDPDPNIYLIIANSGNRPISQVNIDFLDEHIKISNLWGDNAKYRHLVLTDMSDHDTFKMSISVVFNDTYSIVRDFNMGGALKKWDLQISIYDDGKIVFR